MTALVTMVEQTALKPNVNADTVTEQNIAEVHVIHQQILKLVVNAMDILGVTDLVIQIVETVTMMNGVHHQVKVVIVAQVQDTLGVTDLVIQVTVNAITENGVKI